MTGAEHHTDEKGLLKHIQNMCRNSRRRNNNHRTVLKKIENLIQNKFRSKKEEVCKFEKNDEKYVDKLRCDNQMKQHITKEE